MAKEKDITEKQLEALNDVFADIVNVLIFNGRQVVHEDDLEPAMPQSQFKATGTIHEQERDVAKFWKSGHIRLALFGSENQTEVDPDMPLRVFSYDGASYKEQVLQHESAKRTRDSNIIPFPTYPAITLVLHFGKKPWDGPTTLFECFGVDIPDELKPFINDYRLNIIDIAYLTPEQVKLFKSDFRIVADYFVQSRISGDYIPSPEKLTHVDEVLKLMAALTRDDRFINVVNNNDLLCNKEGGISMCEVLDKVEQRGFAAGQAAGQAERDSFYGKLMQLLAPLGRLDELVAATSDKAKLASLAKEFGLKI